MDISKTKNFIRNINGAPELVINNQSVYPLLAWSWSFKKSGQVFKELNIHLLHPVFGMNKAWENPDHYNFTAFETLLKNLLKTDPNALFLPRILFDVPLWWKEKYPHELIKCALPTKPKDDRQYRPVRENKEGGWLWGIQTQEPSFASNQWQGDMLTLFSSFLEHFESSDYADRIIGYQIGAGIYGEWHYFLSEFVPDFSDAMKEKIGYVPTLEKRLYTSCGLFRDPAQETEVIQYYKKFHKEICAGTIIKLARLLKEKTKNRVLCGVFYGYQLENVWMHDGGHLAPEIILNCPDIDFLASPYSYQTTNKPDKPAWEHDVYDDADNWLGRSRGVAGDGGYRVLLESLKRHNKMYFVELDASTYLQKWPQSPNEPDIHDIDREFYKIGGTGCDTREGTLKILKRDMAQQFVKGNGGWLFDFGPAVSLNKSWFDEKSIKKLLTLFIKTGQFIKTRNLSSCSEIAAIYDAKSYFVTRYWQAETPFKKGSHNMDFFSHWYMDAQVRAIHRIGAPVDFMYRFDLGKSDMKKYQLLLMINHFYMDEHEINHIHNMLENSQTTVVWYYAPGFVHPNGINLEQMQKLTGFSFSVNNNPKSLFIRPAIQSYTENIPSLFGIDEQRAPRFSVINSDCTILGVWQDDNSIAFAKKQMNGWTSVYVGTAPVPVEVLRWLAGEASVNLWSDRADQVAGTEDAIMIVATSSGKRSLILHKPMVELQGNKLAQQHDLNMEMGDVYVFLEKSIHPDFSCS